MPIERDSATWRAVKAHCQAEIEKARDALEKFSCNEERARGRIAALRELLALADDKPELVDTDRIY